MTEQVSTDVLNLWFTKAAALLEVGTSVRQSNALLGRLVHRTRARAYRSAFGSGAAPRAVVVCVSADQLLVADAGQSLMASARATGAQLREISRLLGMPVPVYVIVTRLDRVPHFAEYVRNLSDGEVRQVLGSPLPRSEASAGVYAEQASRTARRASIDGLVYKLGEFRVEMLDRENEPANVAGVYEFPREFGKLRKNLNQYLVEVCKPSQLSANPYLRGFYFTGIRARIVERAVSAPAAVERSVAQDAGATQYINLSAGRPAARRAAAAPVMTQSRVPQWTFLPRLLPEVIFGDRSALTATKQSASGKTLPQNPLRHAGVSFRAVYRLPGRLLLQQRGARTPHPERRPGFAGTPMLPPHPCPASATCARSTICARPSCYSTATSRTARRGPTGLDFTRGTSSKAKRAASTSTGSGPCC